MPVIVRIACLLSFLVAAGSVCAQQFYPTSRTDGFVNPRIAGMGRSKGLILNYELLPDSRITSVSDKQSIGNAAGQIDFNRRLQVKLGVPILLKPGLKVTTSFDYRTERFSFDDFGQSGYAFYEDLQGKRLHSLATSMNILKPTRGKRYYALQLKGRISGELDGSRGFTDAMDISVSPLVGWKENAYLTWGVGVRYSRRADGTHTLFPALLYNQTFNRRWGIEALLPAKINIRRNFSERSRMFIGAELKGARYYVFFDEISSRPVSLNWSEVRMGLTYERQIIDWLWFRAGAGLRLPLGLDLDAESNRLFQRNTLIRSQTGMTPYVNVGIFLVPPKKWRF